MHLSRISFLILVICILGFFIRVFQLTQIPNSLSADEVAFGYNAYSILKTGRDEFGRNYPFYLQSFDDSKSPLLAYALIPFVGLLGLNAFAIRFPSVIFGTLAILLFYLLTYELSKNKKLSLLTCLFAAISPWMIQYSRVAIDMEISLFLALLGIYIFLKGQVNKYYLPVSAVIFGLAFYAYHSSRFWVVVFGFILLILYRRINRYLMFSLILFILMTIPYLSLLIKDNAGLRLYAVSVFADQEKKIQESKILLKEKQENIFGANLIHNRRILFFNQAINGYLYILNPEILFSPNRNNQISTTRLFYLWQLPLLLIGCIYLFKNKHIRWLIIGWLIVGYIPGGLTSLPVFDRRIFLNSYPLLFLAALGFLSIYNEIKPWEKSRLLLKFLFVILVSGSVFIYVHSYFIHGPREVVELWGNGMKEIVSVSQQNSSKYEKVYVSLNLNQTLIFYLFYTQYPPEKYLSEGGTISGGYLDERNKFANFIFKFITPKDYSEKNLYVWKVSEDFPCLKINQIVYLTNGTPLANIGEYQPNLPLCIRSLKPL
ncbi:MAG: hypothetical protein UR52_C0002G0115 [Candidatus Gottesmanbacteria bacterium GW2011_GWA1_34_13]|uniref:Glycosyltransferase RgtA/B/C/D-like domain-containing protein n=1 Tax=Candidatus Gottesmanbacteria bacterium GW2011_GWA1_34_13 TaxID=1618434 RepID=A0A0G0DXK7_9BACT|nr:MAG: hypothetical protein UR52_C0002G0115 [Candidatus Gottesmanbacteria bacterium GW2011_GWA1_34_13]